MKVESELEDIKGDAVFRKDVSVGFTEGCVFEEGEKRRVVTDPSVCFVTAVVKELIWSVAPRS